MCLLLNNEITIRFATKDIVVYKLITGMGTKESPYKTLYREKIIAIGETYSSILVKKRKNFKYIIEKGLHSYAFIKGAKECIKYTKGYLIVKCIIPKGSGYYVGKFSGEKSYASSALKYVELYTPKKRIAKAN